MGRTYFLVLCISLSFSSLAFAGLGLDEKSCTDEEKIFNAKSHEVASVKTYRIHTLTLNNGMTIKEYVAEGGIVFGVSWRGKSFNPKFDNLFGKHFAEYQAHASEMPQGKGRRFSSLKTENMTVEMGGHMGSLSGKAYVSNLIPTGITPDDIQ
jgi:hypothetical protein